MVVFLSVLTGICILFATRTGETFPAKATTRRLIWTTLWHAPCFTAEMSINSVQKGKVAEPERNTGTCRGTYLGGRLLGANDVFRNGRYSWWRLPE